MGRRRSLPAPIPERHQSPGACRGPEWRCCHDRQSGSRGVASRGRPPADGWRRAHLVAARSGGRPAELGGGAGSGQDRLAGEDPPGLPGHRRRPAVRGLLGVYERGGDHVLHTGDATARAGGHHDAAEPRSGAGIRSGDGRQRRWGGGGVSVPRGRVAVSAGAVRAVRSPQTDAPGGAG